MFWELLWFPVLFAFLVQGIPVKYDVGILVESDKVIDWGTLVLDPRKPSILEFLPSNINAPPVKGCIGLRKSSGFQCQTAFNHIDPAARQAVKVFLSSQGEVTQVQLAEGNRSDVYVEVPFVAPSIVQKLPQQSKLAAQNDDESFLKKNWTWLVPLGVVVLISLTKNPSAQP